MYSNPARRAAGKYQELARYYTSLDGFERPFPLHRICADNEVDQVINSP
jgi:hypothetical protein